MPKVWKCFRKNIWSLVAFLVILGSLSRPTWAQYDIVDTELEYEEEEVPSAEDQQPLPVPLPFPPDTTNPLSQPAPGTEPEKPTIFKLPVSNYLQLVFTS